MSGTTQYREIGNICFLNECSIKLQEVFMGPYKQGTDMSANHILLCGQILIFVQFRTLKTMTYIAFNVQNKLASGRLEIFNNGEGVTT